MRRFFKGLIYFFISILLVLIVIFSVAYWNRDKILEQITAQLNEGINGEFKIQKLDFTILNDFPNFTLTLRNVSLRDQRFSTYKHDFFVANKVFVDINLYHLWKRNVNVRSLKIETANLFIFRTKDGYTNLAIFKKDSVGSNDSVAQSKNPFLLSLRNIKFKDVQCFYSDSLRNKSYHFHFIDTKQAIVANDSIYSAHIKGKIHFGELVFNEEHGGFLKNKLANADLHVKISRPLHLLTIDQSSLGFEKSKIMLSGNFELAPGGKFQLKFESDRINVAEGKSLISDHINKSLDKFHVDQPINIAVTLNGKTIPNSKTAVDIEFGSSKANVEFGKLHLKNFYFTGVYTNHVDEKKRYDNANSQVTVNPFDGIMNGFPVKGSVVVSELQNPFLKLDVLTEMNLADLNSHIDSARFKFNGGTISTRIKYQGRLAEYVDNTRTKYDGNLHGITYIKEGSFHYKPRRLKLNKMNAVFEFDEEKFKIDSIGFVLNGSPLQINGIIQNFVPFFIQPKNKGYIKLNVTTPRFDLTSLTEKKPGRKTLRQQKQDKKRVSDLMDGIFKKLEFDLNVKVDQLTLRKFAATNFSGRIVLSHQTLEAKPVTMNVAKGTMSLNFKLSDLSKNINPMTVSAKVTNARIKEFFSSFDNFNQNTITSKNLSGLISANVKFNARMDDNLKISAPSMWGDIDVKIKDGRLKDFEPMENMSNFLFKKRDFSDVEFAELNSHFSLKGSDLDINRMEIESSVLSLFVHGRYSFTDSTSLSVQLPLSNLKKRDKTYKPKNVGVDAKVGPSVFLHIYKDEQGKIIINYDPFKKYAKLK